MRMQQFLILGVILQQSQALLATITIVVINLGTIAQKPYTSSTDSPSPTSYNVEVKLHLQPTTYPIPANIGWGRAMTFAVNIRQGRGR